MLSSRAAPPPCEGYASNAMKAPGASVPNAKVVHLTSVHNPFDTRIFHRECKSAARAGYDVVLVASHDESCTVDGIRIRAVPKQSMRLGRFLRTVPRTLMAAWSEDADLYHFHDPELIPVGLLLKAKSKCVVYDVHEDVPAQIATKPWIWPPARGTVARLAGLAERLAERWLDGIIAATPTIHGLFTGADVVTIQNFPDLGEFDGLGVLPYGRRPPLVAYVGGLTEIRGLAEMVQAMSRLPADSAAELALAGEVRTPELAGRVHADPGWRRVKHLGWQTRAQVAELLGRARVGLVVLHPAENHVNAYPRKLFEYMAAGIPAVASDFPLWREIVTTADCGLLVDPRDPDAIAEAIAWLLANPERAAEMGRAGQAAVRAHYDWASEATKLLAFYRRLLDGEAHDL